MIYCISDIHGEYGLFRYLLEKINFSENDTLIILGDMIDKGKNSVEVLRYAFSKPNIKVILGNHEYEFLKYYDSVMKENISNDYEKVLEKLQSYFKDDGHLLTWDIVDKLESLPLYLEFDNFICVHAGVPLDNDGKMKPLEKARTEEIVYDRTFKDYKCPVSSKCIIYGHTPVRYINGNDRFIYYPRNENENKQINDYHKIHIDTGVYLSDVLGCLCIDNCKGYYFKKTYK